MNRSAGSLRCYNIGVTPQHAVPFVLIIVLFSWQNNNAHLKSLRIDSIDSSFSHFHNLFANLYYTMVQKKNTYRIVQKYLHDTICKFREIGGNI
jgi:hypothetical protein